MKKAEQTIRVSTETEKCFVTVREFQKLLREGEFPHISERYFAYATHSPVSIRNNIIVKPFRKHAKTRSGRYLSYQRNFDPVPAILKQKNSSKHWEIDLVSSRTEELRLRKETEAWSCVDKLPQIQELRKIEQAQSEQLEALRERIETLSQEQFDNIITNTQPQL